MNDERKRQVWGSKIGVILAVAGSAVGLGNFLRFPVQAAQNGGGAFMLPYFISLFLLGIPLMWVEWAVGRYGGLFRHGSAPGMFHSLWKNRFIKYFGIIGIFGPLVIFIYYTYIESWLLGYAFYSITGRLSAASGPATKAAFLQGYQGLAQNGFFQSIWPAYIFFVITFFVNFTIISRGIKGGIEILCKIALPTLFLFAVVIAIRVLTLGAPSIAHPDWNIVNGLGYLWNPDLSVLTSAKVWLAAAGQVFFTLSVGMGVILTYASYLSRGDDVVLSGLTASSMNETAEVVLGGSIAIPAAFAFLGPIGIMAVAHSGAFNLGFVTMPLIFDKIPLGPIFSFLWFSLLFLAGMTSSVSMIEPAVSFMEDEFRLDRKRAVLVLAIVTFILMQPVIFFLGHGVMDELDFWGGTFCLVIFALVETVLFVWVFGMDRAWEEIHHGAEMRLPKFYKFIMKYVTPVILIVILVSWFWQQGLSVILMQGILESNLIYVLWTRIGLALLFVAMAILVKIAWKKRKAIPE